MQIFIVEVELDSTGGWDAKIETVAVQAIDWREAHDRALTFYDRQSPVEAQLREVVQTAPIGMTSI